MYWYWINVRYCCFLGTCTYRWTDNTKLTFVDLRLLRRVQTIHNLLGCLRKYYRCPSLLKSYIRLAFLALWMKKRLCECVCECVGGRGIIICRGWYIIKLRVTQISIKQYFLASSHIMLSLFNNRKICKLFKFLSKTISSLSMGLNKCLSNNSCI